ncbi:MAG TPA: hypothetical protein VKB84_20070 [Candidatus Binataceae bacterium]|jgi:hypothetical protein|nr:hypothetical protein [Candidatus Binataceae bacterium]
MRAADRRSISLCSISPDIGARQQRLARVCAERFGIMPPSGDARLFGIGVLELGLKTKEMLPPLKAAAWAGGVGP